MELLFPVLTLVTGFLIAAIADWIVYAAIALTAASTVYSYQATQKAAKDQLKSGGVEITRQDSNAGLTIIYGERAVGGVKVWKDVSQSTFAVNSGRTVFGQGDPTDGVGKTFQLNAWLNRVDVLGQGPVHGITNIEIEDDSYQAPRFAKRNHAIYRGVFMDGNSSQSVLSELVNNSDWKSNSVGTDVAYMYSRFRAGHYSSDKLDRYFSAEPMMRYHVKGRLVWDPRDTNQSSADAGTWLWSDNPALCLLDYLTQPYGRNLDYSQIDIESFKTAADSCDVLVTVPSTTNETGSAITVWDPELGEYVAVDLGADIPNFRTFQIGTVQKRLTCNAALDPSNTVLENVKILLQSMRGTLPYHNGTYSLRLEDTTATSMSFTENDIIGGISFSNGDRSKRFNRTTVVFKNRNRKYKEDRASWPPLDSTEYAALLAEDNDEELFFEVGLDAVTDYYQAEDLAEFITMSSREQLSAGMKVKSKGLLLEPGDVVEVTHETPGWSARKFRVRSVKVNTDQTVDLSMTEYNAHIYTWRPTSQEPLQEDIGLASPFDDKLPVTNLAATITRTDTASGVPQGLVDLTFTAPVGEAVREYLVRFKPVGTSVWLENLYPPTASEETGAVAVQFLAPQHDTTYDLEVNYFDVGGMLGESAVSSFTVPEYRTDLDVDLNTIETEVGEILERENGLGGFIPSDLSDLASYYKNSELVLQTSIDSITVDLENTDGTVTSIQTQLDTDVAALQQSVTDAETYADQQVALVQSQVDGINTTIGDITASTADVYLQTTAPVAGVAGVPDPIPANSRWYDSDDSNHPYVYDGTTWVSIRDGQVGDSAADIVLLQATVDDPVTGVNATADALAVLDTTVTSLNGTVSSNSASIVTLDSTVFDPTTGVAANSSAIGTLETSVAAQGESITSQSTAITELESKLEPTQTVYNQDGIAGNVPNSAAIGTALVHTATIATGGLVGEGYLSILLTNADSTEDVRVGFNGTEIGPAQSADTDTDGQSLWFSFPVTVTDGDQTIEVWNVPSSALAITLDAVVVAVGGIGDPATASATGGLFTRVTAAEGTITSQSGDITSLLNTVNDPVTGVSATSSAVGGLTGRVAVTEDDITANADDITSLQLTVDDPDTGVAANSSAIGGLTTRIAATEGQITSQASDITSLNADLSYRTDVLDETDGEVLGEDGVGFDLENDPGAVASASARANKILDVRVTATEQEIDSQAVEITTLKSRASNLETGVDGNASALNALTTRVTTSEGDITAQAADIAAIQADITDASTGLQASANAISGLTVRVTNTEGDISTNAQDITAIQTQVEDPETGLQANSSAITALDSRVVVNEGDIQARSADIVALQNTVDDPTTGVAATSTALAVLDSRVDVTETAIALSSSDITILQNQIAPASLVHSSGPIDETIDAASDSVSGLVYNFTPAGDVPLGTGYLHVLIDGADTDDDFRVGYNGTEVGGAQVDSTQNNNSEQWFTFAVLTTTGQQTVTVWNPEETAGHVKGIILTYGGVGDPEGMFRGDDNVAQITATSEAVSGLESTVYAEDGVTAAWSSDIVSLNNAISDTGGLTDRLDDLESADPDMVVFRQDDEPTAGLVPGALWVDTDDNNKLYVYDGTTWNVSDDGRISANSGAIATLESSVYAEDGVTVAWSSDITSLSNSISGTGGISDRLGTLETADPEMVVFRQDEEPTTTIVGALWVDTSRNRKMFMWNGSNWQPMSDERVAANSTAVTALNSTVFAEDGVTAAWSSDITSLSNSISGEGGVNDRLSGLETAPADMVVFNQDAEPTTDVVGALWIDSDDSNKLYTWDGTQWVNGTPQIDGMTVFYQASQPSTDVVGALWFDADDNFKTYVWDGTTWQAAQDPRIGSNATAVNELQSSVYETDGTTTAWSADITALQSTVDDPTTGVSATASAVSGLSTTVTGNADAITALEAEWYVDLDVNGHMSGIKLFNTGDTSSFTVTADEFKVVKPYVEGEQPVSAAPFTINTAGTITMNASVEINGNLVVDGTITQTQLGNGSVGGDQIINGSVGANELEISADSDGTGERMFFNGTDNRIEIFDASDVLRVALGDLTGI